MREIEAACQVSKLPSTSSCLEQPSPFAPPNNHDEKKKSGTSSSRQSTLHEFVGKAKVVPRPQVKVFQEQHFGNERLPAVQIDVQAAKTWIYPGRFFNLYGTSIWVSYNLFRLFELFVVVNWVSDYFFLLNIKLVR